MCVNVCVFMGGCACKRVCKCVYMLAMWPVCVCVCKCVYMLAARTPTHEHTHAHSHTHTHTCTFPPPYTPWTGGDKCIQKTSNAQEPKIHVFALSA